MTNNQYYENMGYPACSPIAGYPNENLESMYPEVYNRIYPRVRNICAIMDTPNNPNMYPCPRREAVERMTDDIYMEVMNEMNGNWGAMAQQQIPGYNPTFGRGGFLRDLISIILIRELLFRRGRRYY